MTLTSILWRDGVEVAHDFPLSELDQHLSAEHELVWFDLGGTDHERIVDLASELGLDPFAVEDAVKRNALALGLPGCLSSPDPALRDGIAYEALAQWMRRDQLDLATRRRLRDRLLAMLQEPDAEGFRRGCVR